MYKKDLTNTCVPPPSFRDRIPARCAALLPPPAGGQQVPPGGNPGAAPCCGSAGPGISPVSGFYANPRHLALGFCSSSQSPGPLHFSPAGWELRGQGPLCSPPHFSLCGPSTWPRGSLVNDIEEFAALLGPCGWDLRDKNVLWLDTKNIKFNFLTILACPVQWH